MKFVNKLLVFLAVIALAIATGALISWWSYRDAQEVFVPYRYEGPAAENHP